MRVATVLVLGLALLGIDLFDDVASGVPPLHMLEEVLVVVFSLGWIAHLVTRRASLRRASDVLATELVSTREALRGAHREMRFFSEGLAEKVDAQLETWGLTPSEKEVALLLLKGLGLRKIGEIRETSERTVRQQAASVYQKAGLAGRAELSAYFFEDILVLPAKATPSSADAVGESAAHGLA